jgi:hypothetical protein
MLRYAVCVVLLGSAWANWIPTIRADDQQPAQGLPLERSHGRWSTSRERREGERVRRSQLTLEFRNDELTLCAKEDGKKGNQFILKVNGIEEGKNASSLLLSHGGSKYVIYYDFQGERLILVGNLLNRPFEGFSLSGECQRAEEHK